MGWGRWCHVFVGVGGIDCDGVVARRLSRPAGDLAHLPTRVAGDVALERSGSVGNPFAADQIFKRLA